MDRSTEAQPIQDSNMKNPLGSYSQIPLGSVKQLTVHDAMDFYLSARKKTQLYRGTARLSDTAIEQKYKQNGQINV